MRLLYALLLLCVLPPGLAAGQGYTQVNGRNHPELDWQRAETAHFNIMYPAHLAGIELQAAALAEASYDSLAAAFQVTFDDKIRIYLSDEDEIANGFAVPLGTGFTNIWVHANNFAAQWTGTAPWLRKVIAHELAHLFHYRATRSNLGVFSYLFSQPRPRAWSEGLAQYLTEDWDAQRGERWLRTATLEARPSYTDEASAWNDQLLYATGHAQVRYFADQYGDSALVQVMRHRKPALLGLGKVHHFRAAFREVTGESYSTFTTRWENRVATAYQVLASRLEHPKDLPVDSLPLPLQYLNGARYSPNLQHLALVGQPTLARPVRGLYLWDASTNSTRVIAEGRVLGSFDWHPDGDRLAYARQVRGDHGSLVNDLFLVHTDGSAPQRLSFSLRASAPTFSPDGNMLAFVAMEQGTANVFMVDLAARTTVRLTAFKGNVQINALTWHPKKPLLALSRMTDEGAREVLLLDVQDRTVQALYSGPVDYRNPVWAPHTDDLAVTSLQDGVPNVFIFDVPPAANPLDRLWPAPVRLRRATHLATGAWAEDWLPPSDDFPEGRLLIRTGETKTRDVAYLLDARHLSRTPAPIPPVDYARWTLKKPTHPIPRTVAPNPALITNRAPYRAWRNLTHVVSGALPYYRAANNWGLAAGTAWVEPLGKHAFGAFGALSVADLAESVFVGRYINRVWRPEVTLGVYRFPASARGYGKQLLIESIRGGDVSWRWPLELTDAPYTSARLAIRLRVANVEALNADKFVNLPDDLPQPESALQTELRIGLRFKKLRPYADNVIHPLDGYGVRLRLEGVPKLPESDLQFIRPELSGYKIFQGPGWSRWYLHGRARLQFGTSLAQDFIGFSRSDGFDLNLSFIRIGSDLNRVRGYRRYAIGNRVLFSTLEYRVPLLRGIDQKLLPFLELGYVSAAGFADAGAVWNHTDWQDGHRQLGVGAEIKYTLEVGGIKILHAFGVAQALIERRGAGLDFYQRFETALPF